MATGRYRSRGNVAKIARTSARREEMREQGVWSLFEQAVTVTGNSSQARVDAVTLSPVPTQVVSVYGLHLSASLALVDAPTGTPVAPVVGAIAVTKLSAAEQVANTQGPGVIANPALESDINDRPWRAWMPFQLTGVISTGQPWAFSPVRLPLRGMWKLDVGQRVAMLLALPGGANQASRQVRLQVWGRFRYIVHRGS